MDKEPRRGAETSEYTITKIALLISAALPVLGIIFLAFGLIPLEAFLALLTAGPAASWASTGYAKSRGMHKAAQAAADKRVDDAVARALEGAGVNGG